MSVDETVAADSAPPVPVVTLPVASGTREWTVDSERRAGTRRLALIALAVVVLDWGSKAAAWRWLPGSAVVNADTSGALPILPGVVSQPMLGALVDAGALILLAVSARWLVSTDRLGAPVWSGVAMVWAGIASNAADRWLGHLWIAPGSRRGVIDWISIGGGGSINLADIGIGVGVVVAIAGLAVTRLPRVALAAVVGAIALLMPISVLTVDGLPGNATAAPVSPTYSQRVRTMLWVSPRFEGRHSVYRDISQAMGWNLSLDAVDAKGRVLAQWHLAADSRIAVIRLPARTSAVHVRLEDTGWTMTLADGLD